MQNVWPFVSGTMGSSCLLTSTGAIVVPIKQPIWIWVDGLYESTRLHVITTTKTNLSKTVCIYHFVSKLYGYDKHYHAYIQYQNANVCKAVELWSLDNSLPKSQRIESKLLTAECCFLISHPVGQINLDTHEEWSRIWFKYFINIIQIKIYLVGIQ